jgi:hypothetical protein
MYCTNCGSENADSGQYCWKCGQHHVARTREVEAQTLTIEATNPKPYIAREPEPQRLTIWHWFRISFVLFWCYVYAVLAEKTPYMSYFDPGLMGYWFGTLVFPFSIAYFIGGRGRDWEKFSKWLFWLGLIIPMVAYSGNSRHSQLTTEQKAGQLLRQSIGATPPSRIGNDNEEEEFAVLRATMTDAFDSIRPFTKDPRCGDLSPALYSAQSYERDISIRSSISYVQTCLALQHDMLGAMDAAILRGKPRIDAQSWSQSRKDSVWQHFYDGYQKSRPNWKTLVDKEAKWTDDTVRLYQFTLDHRDKFTVQNGQLLFSDDVARIRFNELVNATNDSRTGVLKASEELQRASRDYLGRYGVSQQEVEKALTR